MRKFILILAYVCGFGSALVNPPQMSTAHARHTDARLDRLFAQLQSGRTEPEIDALKLQINAIWEQSGSDAIDLLMARAAEAGRQGAGEVAVKILDEILVLEPRFAEAWVRRGLLRAAQGNQAEALSDLREGLQLEQRHFVALDQIGRMHEQARNFKAALEAYQRLLEIIPQADGLRSRIQILQEFPPGPQPI